MAHQYHRVNGLIGQIKAGDIIALVAFWLVRVERARSISEWIRSAVTESPDCSCLALGCSATADASTLSYRFIPTTLFQIVGSFVGASAHVCVCVCACVCVCVCV